MFEVELPLDEQKRVDQIAVYHKHAIHLAGTWFKM